MREAVVVTGDITAVRYKTMSANQPRMLILLGSSHSSIVQKNFAGRLHPIARILGAAEGNPNVDSRLRHALNLDIARASDF